MPLQLRHTCGANAVSVLFSIAHAIHLVVSRDVDIDRCTALTSDEYVGPDRPRSPPIHRAGLGACATIVSSHAQRLPRQPQACRPAVHARCDRVVPVCARCICATRQLPHPASQPAHRDASSQSTQSRTPCAGIHGSHSSHRRICATYIFIRPIVTHL